MNLKTSLFRSWVTLILVAAGCAKAPPVPTVTPTYPPMQLECPSQFCRKAELDVDVANQCAAQTARELEPFKALTLRMSFAEVCARVGAPDWDAGSGLMISVYDLADGSRILIGFSGPDQMLYIRRLTTDGGEETILQ